MTGLPAINYMALDADLGDNCLPQHRSCSKIPFSPCLHRLSILTMALISGKRVLFALALLTFLIAAAVQAEDCSKTKLCAAGCCSKFGFCGTTKDHCGAGCQSTCDFKLGCDADNPCKGNECCSKFGFCGLGPDCTFPL